MDFKFLSEQVATGENQTYWDWIVSGLAMTATVSVVGFFLAVIIGIVLGSLRTTSGRTKQVADILFEGVRSIPFLAQLFIGYFVLPSLLFPQALKTMNQEHLVLGVGIISLALYMGVRISAQVTAGIQALPASQLQAAKALGFTKVQAYTHFLIPQALRNILPSLTSEAMNTVKNSAVISTIGLVELTKQAGTIIDFTAKPFEAFTIILLGYLLINAVVLGAMKLITRYSKLA